MSKPLKPRPYPNECVIIHRHTATDFRLAVSIGGFNTSNYKRSWRYNLPNTIQEIFKVADELIEINEPLKGFPVWLWSSETGWLPMSSDEDRIKYVLVHS